VEHFEDGATLSVGALRVTAHRTAGHTPGGTTWSWVTCEDGRCLDIVYADSLTPVSADGFEFSDSDTYPTAVEDFQRGFATLESIACDILLTPHPGASSLWERMERGREALVDADGCRRYAAAGRQQLNRRLQAEGVS
jgi:metallo-beta-lactamase class B